MSKSTIVIEVVEETEADRGWRFELRLRGGGCDRAIDLRLDWTDYDHWSHGRLTPSEVAAGALRCAAALAGPDRIPARVDASSLRRLAPGLDERIGEHFTPRA